MKVLIITPKCDESTNIALFNLFSAATAIEPNFDVLVLGNNLENFVKFIAQYNIKQILAIDSELLADEIAIQNIDQQLVQIIKNYTHVLVQANSFGRNLLPRIAGRLGISQVSEITDILSANVFKRFTYAGNIAAKIESNEEIKLITVRTINFKLLKVKAHGNTNIVNLPLDNTYQNKIKVINQNKSENIVDLTNAKIVVCGGKSLGSKENFESYINTLATKLNAAVGATRAAVDIGYASNDLQIGQTGKIIAPQVYISFGVAGAMQHISGIKDSQMIISINTDPNASIFEYSDYGVVADLFEVIIAILREKDAAN